ncbi:MAG: hypothetical protein IJT32_05670, partial [Lachnospiraceae bacterium]|nr:hypothetical protein [Lachnospiraceae bacterium]
MKKKLRLLCLLMALLFFGTSLAPFGVYAEELSVAAKDAKGNLLLTGVEIGGLDEPKAGVKFDDVAMVSSAQGISWSIPVVWVSENGTQVSLAAPNQKCLPVFVFYLPKGYAVATNESGKAQIKVPAFVNALYGKDAATTVVYDPAIGVAFITGGATSFNPSSYWSSNGGSSSSSSGSSSGGSFPGGGSSDAKTDGKKSSDQAVDTVSLYCDKTALKEFDHEFLEYLVNLIRNEVEPKAVSLLLKRFPAFQTAASKGELSSEIGLYIYHGTGYCDGEKAMEGALAYVSGQYNKNKEYTLLVGVNTKQFEMKKNTSTGKLELTEKGRNDLDNTLVHEMLHAFMDDYLRYGMMQEAYDVVGEEASYGFPYWFIEGSATTVDNVYQFRNYALVKMADQTKLTWNAKDDDYTGPVEYTKASVLARYTDGTLTGDNRYDLSFSKEEKKTNSAYVAGYLACVYLGAMAANHLYYADTEENADFRVFGADGRSINLTAITDGLNYLMEEMHKGASLSEMVKSISNVGFNGSEGPEYKDLADFQASFIKGENTTGGEADVEKTDGYSLGFVVDYLNYLENSVEGEKIANGSILFENQDFKSPLAAEELSTDTSVYRINKPGRQVSDVDNDAAYNKTGGGTTVPGERNDEGVKEDSSVDDGDWEEYDEGQYDEEFDDGQYDDGEHRYIVDDDGDDTGDG